MSAAPNPAPADPATITLPTGAIACLSLAAFGSGVALRVNDPLLPRLALDFGLSLGQASQVISLFSIAYGVSQWFFGPLGDRFGKYRVIAWAVLASALTSLLCGLAPGFDSLRLARVAAGATAAAIIPLAMAWIGDVIPYQQRQPVLARFLIGQIFGLTAGVSLGGVAADHLGWRLPFLLLALLFVAVGLGLLRMNRALPAAARQHHVVAGSPLRRLFSEYGQVLAMPWARVILVTVFLEGMFLYGPFAFTAAHLHTDLGLSLTQAGLLVMLFGLGGLVFALGSSRLVPRLGEVRLVRAGGLVLAVSLLLLALGPHWAFAIPGCLGTGLGFYMLHNTLQVNATQMAPERRGAAVSAFASCFFLGQSAGVALVGLLVGPLGIASVMAIGAVGLLGIALQFGRVRARRLPQPA